MDSTAKYNDITTTILTFKPIIKMNTTVKKTAVRTSYSRV